MWLIVVCRLLWKWMFLLSRRVLPVLQSGCAGLRVRAGLFAGDQGSAFGGDRVSVRSATLQLWSQRESGRSLHQGNGRKLPLWRRRHGWWIDSALYFLMRWFMVCGMLWFSFQRFNSLVDSHRTDSVQIHWFSLNIVDFIKMLSDISLVIVFAHVQIGSVRVLFT